ncbi:bd22cc01-b515-4430-a5a3-13b97dd1ba12 [Sclerotinia trifoliorum]|uniref:D-arabinitol 2-dehydrogenase [ribulose-forming] n=1 Tax=Sclerotinia trifoliorum TaxID=28548 RepID=A0A8H2W191_9HELO|nr:bd22cc01-b515-4430-a5a3-13b97dd1ba12 [Sclerotinia trifoliorum]
MEDNNYDRNALVNRTLPQMQLASGSNNSASPSLDTKYIPPSLNSATERFAVKGNAIITGGTGTLALQGTRALLEHGLSGVVLFDINPKPDSPSISSLKADFPYAKILLKSVDVTNAENVNQAVQETAKELGSIDILCCYAGVVGCVHALKISVEEWRRTLEINTTGAFICAQAVAKKMIDQKSGGSIVFIASISAHTVNYPQPQIAYNVSKSSLIHMKSCLAAEWSRYGIRTNTISPGYMDTVLNEGAGLEEARNIWTMRNPMGRMGNPEELSGALVLLCSRAGSYINGSDLIVDGGQTVF